jgi:integrase
MKKGIGKFETSHLKWDEFTRVISELRQDGDVKWMCTMALCTFFALRVSDLLTITWEQVRKNGLIVDEFEIYEIKTKNSKPKPRIIPLSEDGKKMLQMLWDKTNPNGVHEFVFNNGSLSKPTTHEYINYNLRRIFTRYKLDYTGNISSHLFRKTFGYRYAEINDFSAESLVYLNRIFRHKTIAQTMVYLGLETRQIKQAYFDVCQL